MDMKSISQKLQDDIRAIMEAGLHPNQQKIDVHEPEKDEITAHDFKKLRAMKKDQHGKITKEDTDEQIQELAGKAAQQAAIAISLIKAGKKDGKMPKPMKEDSVQEEEKKKVVSPFDYKKYKSEIPRKPGELTGHDSKKISTGTVYTKKPVKEESHQSKTTMKHIPNPSPALKKAAKDIKPGIAGIRDRFDMLDAGGVKREEVEELEELSMQTMQSAKEKLGAKALDAHYSDDKRAARDYAGRALQMGAKIKRKERAASPPVKIDEISLQTMQSAKEKLGAKALDAHYSDDKRAARDYAGRALSMQAGMNRRARRVAKEEVEQNEYTFADYLEAVRAQYGDEDAVLIANEAFKNQDITLFTDQSQSPEA
jgi:hypothetical protein